MPILKDTRGNEFLGSIDQLGGLTFTDARTISYTLSTLNAEVVVGLNGHAAAAFELRTAAGNLTVTFEATMDDANWFALPGWNVLTETMVQAAVITTTSATTYIVGVTGFRKVRARVSAYTSGNVTIAARASAADFAIYSRPVPSTLHVTATAAAASGVTLTIPAAGVGLFHYITNINIMRNATAALAGTATLVVTSTNLPGSPAWSVGNAMAAGGTQLDLDYSPTTPLKSSVANTATTIVTPAPGAAVLWRVNVSYYVGA